MTYRPDPNELEWFVEQLYYAAYHNDSNRSDVKPGYEYAVNQLISNIRANTGLPSREMERVGIERAKNRWRQLNEVGE